MKRSRLLQQTEGMHLVLLALVTQA